MAEEFIPALNRSLPQPMKVIPGKKEEKNSRRPSTTASLPNLGRPDKDKGRLKKARVSMPYMENLNELQHKMNLSTTQLDEHLVPSSQPDSLRPRSRAQNVYAAGFIPQAIQIEPTPSLSHGEADGVLLDRRQKQGLHHTNPTVSNDAELKTKKKGKSKGAVQIEVTQELNCPLDITKDAQSLFDRYAKHDGNHGYLNYENFGAIVGQIMKSTKQELSEEDMATKIEVSWREADRNYNGQVDFDEFAIWYSSWGFQQEVLLSPNKIRTRDFARKFDLNVADVDSVLSKFQLFDEDGSGAIEFQEFEKMMYKLMKIPRGQELPPKRLKHFWKEIDIDGSGTVCFDEFLQWYCKYFDVKGNSDVSPIEQFYSSVRPSLGQSM